MLSQFLIYYPLNYSSPHFIPTEFLLIILFSTCYRYLHDKPPLTRVLSWFCFADLSVKVFSPNLLWNSLLSLAIQYDKLNWLTVKFQTKDFSLDIRLRIILSIPPFVSWCGWTDGSWPSHNSTPAVSWFRAGKTNKCRRLNASAWEIARRHN